MKPTYKALIAGLLLAALIPFAPAAYAADPAKPQDNAAPKPESDLHEIGDSTAAAPAAPAAPAVTAAPAAPAEKAANAAADAATAATKAANAAANAATAAATKAATAAAVKGVISMGNRADFDDDQHNRVSVNGSTYVGPNETVEGNAVAVMGPVTVDGTVNGNAVSILGSNTINGVVHGNAVVVLGTMRLGPNARVDGNAVAAAGRVIKEPGAVVGGNLVQQATGLAIDENSAASSLWHHGLKMGRPLAFGPHLLFVWFANICLIALYALLALLFPGGVKKCGDTLMQRPGITLLTGFLTMVGLPVLFILLCITIVGIPVALVVLPLGILASVIFGKSAVYGIVGHSIAGKQVHPSLAVILGAVVFVLFYLIPFIGLALWVLVAFLGFACALTTLFTSSKAAPAPVAPAAIPPALAAAGLVPQEAPAGAPQPPVAEAVPPAMAASAAHVSEVALPRAGFWIRMVALTIDVILIGILTHMTHLGHFFLLVLAAYGAILWKLRGATIGDIIFGLKVVRVDGQPSEWVTVIVRALACFFSLICVGLGFIWIALDREKQGWHDKIAGTVVVRHPKGTSLV